MESTGLGAAEVTIIVILGVGTLLATVIIGSVLFAMSRSRALAGGNWSIGEPSGSPKRIRLLDPNDGPISESARWIDGELHVKSEEWASKSLFDVPLDHVEQCMLSYRFRITTENLPTAVYPEMWCRVPEKGQFFSRGVNQKVRGTHHWKEVEIPFYLQAGQRADLLHLNLLFEGAGSVRLKDIEVLATPLK